MVPVLRVVQSGVMALVLSVSPAQRRHRGPGSEPQTPGRGGGANLQQPRCRLLRLSGGGVSGGDGAPGLGLGLLLDQIGVRAGLG